MTDSLSGTFYESINFDNLVKSQGFPFGVIPAEAGIQCFQKFMADLDPGLVVIPDSDPGRGDYFL
ncbi:MAG: hypothetical protein JRD02_00215 [Deltaproteobacteria bacterium]|nr:hypothetical protein [Deltaproteobacteria bacterium]